MCSTYIQCIYTIWSYSVGSHNFTVFIAMLNCKIWSVVADGLKIVVDLGKNCNDGIKIMSCKIKLLNNCYLYKN